MDRITGKRYDYASFTMTNGIAVVLKKDKYFPAAHIGASFSNMKQGGVVLPYNHSFYNDEHLRMATEKYYAQYLASYSLENCADSTDEKIQKFITARIPLFIQKDLQEVFNIVYHYAKYQMSFTTDKDGNKMFTIEEIDRCIKNVLSICK